MKDLSAQQIDAENEAGQEIPTYLGPEDYDIGGEEHQPMGHHLAKVPTAVDLLLLLGLLIGLDSLPEGSQLAAGYRGTGLVCTFAISRGFRRQRFRTRLDAESVFAD